MLKIDATIISQYGTSPTITQMVRYFNVNIDPQGDIDQFYDYIWNIDTAQGFGLDILGRIVDIGRTLAIATSAQYLGFSEAGGQAQPFNQAPFYNGVPPTSDTYFLSDDVYRKLILVKSLSNISAVNAPALNLLLRNLFGNRGRCYVNEVGTMAIRYTFEFKLTSSELAIITQSGAMPRPAGVSVSMFNSSLPLFGFSEAGSSAAPFGQGVFTPTGAIHANI